MLVSRNRTNFNNGTMLIDETCNSKYSKNFNNMNKQ